MKKHIIWLLVIVMLTSSILLLVGCESEGVTVDYGKFNNTFETDVELEGFEDEVVLRSNVENSALEGVFDFTKSIISLNSSYSFTASDLDGTVLDLDTLTLASGDNYFIITVYQDSVENTTEENDEGETVTVETIVYTLMGTHILNVHVLEEVTVTYYVFDTVFHTDTVMEGSSITAPSVNPTDTDNEFVGWVDEQGAEIDFGTFVVYGNVELFASWTNNVVTLELGGGSIDGDTSFIVPNDTILGDDLAIPTMDGMVFSGWCTDDGEYFDAYTDEIFSDITLVAQWSLYSWSYDILQDGTISIAYTGNNSGSVVVPTEINGYTVSALSRDAFNGYDGVTSITIGGHITSIGEWAFAYCSALTEIEIPTSIESIGTYAFAGCSSLTYVYIPNGVTSIGNFAFTDCDSLVLVDISDSVTTMGSYVFKYCDSQLVVNCEASEEPSKWSSTWNAYGGTAVFAAPIKNYLTVDLNGGTMEGDTVMLVEYAFDINNLVVTMDGYYLSGWCYENGKLFDHNTTTITQDVVLVAQWSQYQWSFTELSDGTLSLSYAGDDIATVEVPSTLNGCVVSQLSANAFAGYVNLTTLTIPDSIVFIGDNAFDGCTSLDMTQSGDCLYVGTASNPYMYLVSSVNTSVTEVIIHADTVIISNSAFDGCTSLQSVTIPANVTYIGYGAFANSGLTSIVIPSTVTFISTGILAGCDSITSVTTAIIGSVMEDANITYFGYLFGADSYESQGSVIPSSLTYVELTDMTKLFSYAFYGCDSIVEIVLPETLTSGAFGDNVFENCTSLTTIDMPDSITTIRQYTFAGCTSLTNVTVSASVFKIEEYAFYNCTSLTVFEIGNTYANVDETAFEGSGVVFE